MSRDHATPRRGGRQYLPIKRRNTGTKDMGCYSCYSDDALRWVSCTDDRGKLKNPSLTTGR